MSEPWQFWIDVGGTFTDCFARRPDGRLLRHKVLSSGVTKGSATGESTVAVLVDPLRARDPAGFWQGYWLTLFDSAGEATERTRVAGFDKRGALRLDPPLSAAPAVGQTYELSAGEDAPVLAIRYLLGLRLTEAIPPVAVRLGTTRGTNALLTRRGARTGLVTTRGFRDVLRIAYQNRPRLFARTIHKPAPLFEDVIEIDERITHDGQVLRTPEVDAVRRDLERLRARGIESLAICLLHAYGNASHEELVAAIAREVGFEEISLSSRVAPLVKIVSRGDTTVVDAYLNPVLRTYLSRLRGELGPSDLRLLSSAGGLASAEHFTGKDSILSGPAGGVVGFSRVAQNAGFARAIGFDMGGTSTDVSRFDGRYELEYETEKAGVRVVTPMMAIETVAAGGGSICRFDGVRLCVGPDSAGADPGPACYGRGGPLAVTDMNFFLGRIPPQRFPFPLHRDAVERQLTRLCEEIAERTGTRYTPYELADGFLQVANAHMAKAIRSISTAKGADQRQYVLVAFGGAAPQHACAVARQLGMREVLNHPDSGILSAYGIGLADVVRHRAAGVYQPYSHQAVAALAPTFVELAEQARAEVLSEGVPPERIEVRTMLDLRYRGLEAQRTISTPEDENYAAAFEAEHLQVYGYLHRGRPLEIVAARVEVTGRSGERLAPSRPAPPRMPAAVGELEVYFHARPHRAPLFEREQLVPGDRLAGPAIVAEAVSTTVIDPGWTAEVLTGGELLLRDEHGAQTPHVSDESDPVLLEVFNNLFAGIAERMGLTLRNTAGSVNVKERLDFSCALFTAEGNLVVNAPHIPVHLGAMGETVRQILADNPHLEPGDVFVTNDPYRGGSHLPDVTVVTPVHGADRALQFFTASRAHHAEIGGIRPGSMPPFSKNLAEEGVLIRNFRLVAAGESRLDALRELLLTARYPTRNVEDNLADIAAQVAANQQGVRELRELVARYSLPVVTAYMRHIQAAAAAKTRQALQKLPQGVRRFIDHLDDGSPIAIAVTVDGERARIDFTGTGPVLLGNLNGNRAIVSAAVLYCLRLLIDEDIPLNQGVLDPVEIILPECLLNPRAGRTAEECPAVAGGNVETSQRVVDVLLGAFGLAAASQGTMNNLLFGDATFGYYETIGGGAGATPDADGADAVHTHMTNTRLTDPEVLERRYPVRVQEFAIRDGSGGAGRHRGGNGIVRRLEFLKPLDVSLLTQRRGPYAPYGLAGGSPGALGRNTLAHADGRVESLPGQTQLRVEPGDVLSIETPGGGGYGD